MTKEQIIEIIERAFERELHWEEKATDELFELIEQEKKEVAKKILKSLYDEAISQQGEIVELTAYYIKNTLAKEYGVKL